MRTQGRLSKWNADRGFGYIAPDDGGAEVFVHISALPGEAPPEVGEILWFETAADNKGRVRARALTRAAHPTPPLPVWQASALTRPPRRRFPRPLLLALVTLGIYAYTRQWTDPEPRGREPAPTSAHELATEPAPSPAADFSCDGRTQCAQMRSCAEALHFHAHCPATELGASPGSPPCPTTWCAP